MKIVIFIFWMIIIGILSWTYLPAFYNTNIDEKLPEITIIKSEEKIQKNKIKKEEKNISIKKIVEPVRVVEKIVEPVRVVEKIVEPVRVVEKIVEPVRVVEKIVEPVRVVEKIVEPVRVVEKIVEPVRVVEKIVEPVRVVEKIVEPVRVVEKIVEPVRVVEKKISYPILLKSWKFYSTDIKSSWDIKIYDYGDKKILRIENLKTTNWPDLKVYLWNKFDLKNENDLHLGKLKISSLKANTGNQNYILPKWINLDNFNSVAIHCETYNHSFWFANIK